MQTMAEFITTKHSFLKRNCRSIKLPKLLKIREFKVKIDRGYYSSTIAPNNNLKRLRKQSKDVQTIVEA